MKCVSCGAELAEHAKFCTICGTPVKKEEPAAPVVDVPPVAPPVVKTAPVTPPPVQSPVMVMPHETKLLGPWAYFGLRILFSIPLVGFICLIVFSLDDSNRNRRNFARSYWCSLIIGLALIIAVVILLLVTGAGAALVSELETLSL